MSTVGDDNDDDGTRRTMMMTADNDLDDINRKDQLDEIQALESIYSSTPECFSYNVSIKPNCTITGSIKIVLPKIDKQITVCADSKIINVHYLPPLLLCFTFPPDYPSSSMPQFSLQTAWLNSTAKHQLSEILNDSWADYRGIPVLFTWIELLKEEAMRIVESLAKIDLNEITSSGENSNTIVENGAPGELLKTFIEYNEQAIQDEFNCAWYDCEVCFNSQSGKDCIRFTPCGHVFCVECVSEYYRQKLHDNMIRQLECLNDGCDSIAMQTQIRRVLTDHEFELYEQRLLEGTLDLMSDVVTCPRISCQAPVIIDDGKGGTSSLASCSLCHYSFCILCRKTYHGVEPCSLTFETRLKLLQQLENATASEREEIYKRFGGRKQFERQLEVLKSEQWIESNSKSCPSCHAKIEKNDGCNKMTCSKCGHHFCWLCGAILNKKDPYSHFNMPGSKSCYNRLFEGMADDEDDEDDWFLDGSDTDED